MGGVGWIKDYFTPKKPGNLELLVILFYQSYEKLYISFFENAFRYTVFCFFLVCFLRKQLQNH